MLLDQLWNPSRSYMGMEVCAALLLLVARLGGGWRARPAAEPGQRGGRAAAETTGWLPTRAAHAGRESLGASGPAGNAHSS